jgi:uncharacterized protein (DUF2252 family)
MAGHPTTAPESPRPAQSAAVRESVAERVDRGRRARALIPRATHGQWAPSQHRDPVAQLEGQAASRIAELVPIRYGRMMATPATFYRGAAAVMAQDLAQSPISGLEVQLCGDAHMTNFGGFASPERSLVFDLNDFDETLPGPWEWDLKRLAASVEVNARERGLGRKARRSAVRATVCQYRQAMRGFASMGELETWYSRLDEATLERVVREQALARQAKALQQATKRARQKDSTRAFTRLARTTANGETRIRSDPPLVVPIAELLPEQAADSLESALQSLLAAYGETLQGDRQALFERYRFLDLARKVVGVGSVGTACWIVLLQGRDESDPLFLQCKEAQPSVLEPYLAASRFENEGQRVVEGQRMMQSASDIFLGWLRNNEVPGGGSRDFYVRQLWDWKLSADPGAMEPDGLVLYARVCASSLARAHARSGDPVAIGAYLGAGSELDRALVEFAELYADQNERDHSAFVAAIRAGRLQAAVA